MPVAALSPPPSSRTPLHYRIRESSSDEWDVISIFKELNELESSEEEQGEAGASTNSGISKTEHRRTPAGIDGLGFTQPSSSSSLLAHSTTPRHDPSRSPHTSSRRLPQVSRGRPPSVRVSPLSNAPDSSRPTPGSRSAVPEPPRQPLPRYPPGFANVLISPEYAAMLPDPWQPKEHVNAAGPFSYGMMATLASIDENALTGHTSLGACRSNEERTSSPSSASATQYDLTINEIDQYSPSDTRPSSLIPPPLPRVLRHTETVLNLTQNYRQSEPESQMVRTTIQDPGIGIEGQFEPTSNTIVRLGDRELSPVTAEMKNPIVRTQHTRLASLNRAKTTILDGPHPPGQLKRELTTTT
ncbi:hypothetical protein HGRIS_004272 [Hohenbuehelia grisea]|uniref:Uncharacterized protein n=1 Tax=Hohenbuehelia grisea TaxID=104357 RepID=A0ABR3IPB0_9AGAR